MMLMSVSLVDASDPPHHHGDPPTQGDWRAKSGRVVIDSAYLLSDMAAIYALGHMSVISPTSQEH